MLNERNVYVLNKNFELIFGSLNRDILPRLESIQKFIRKQRGRNTDFTYCILATMIYIIYNEYRAQKHEEELQKVKDELYLMNLTKENK